MLKEAPVSFGFFRRNLRFGILQRYVIGEVSRAFGLALLTITCVFVLLTVMTKAASIGLGPYEILTLVPYMIPASLPYTVPVSLLFAATVVYGRLASDNEVIAVKTAGLSAMVLIWPSILMSLVLSLSLAGLSSSAIPNSNGAVKKIFYQNMEDFFYKKLKMDRIADFPSWPFLIKVKDVQDRTLIGATFKKRAAKPEQASFVRGPDADEPAAWDLIVQSKTARIKFDFEHEQVHVFFENANVRQRGVEKSEGTFKETTVVIEIPGKGQFDVGKTVEEMTVQEMKDTQADYLEKISMERKRQAVAAAWYLGSGRPDLVKWDHIQAAFSKYDYWQSECKKFETEIQMRQAMAWGSFFFVILGAPVGILFARRDFLSAFISCFMPIILVYYPLMLFGVNLGKEGLVPPELVWIGNIALGLAALLWALPPVRKH
jgi:lipopolysaccharide export system permease protein